MINRMTLCCGKDTLTTSCNSIYTKETILEILYVDAEGKKKQKHNVFQSLAKALIQIVLAV